MRVQIYGAGISGSYLYHLLEGNGFDVRIYDVRKNPDCRCAWGFSYSECKELYKLVGLNIDDYVLSKPKYLIINDKVWLKNKEITILDKKALLEELWSFELVKDDADIVVDATGVSRAMLPKIENDSIYQTVQFIEKHDLDENIYVFMRKTGYAWAFPLGDRWHIGAGDLNKDRALELIHKLRELYGLKDADKECNCYGRIRMLPPSKCKPIVHENVYGVGEAIGCVSGGGEGNAPSLKCAEIFFRCLSENRLDEYEKEVFKEFWWIELEHEFLWAVQNDKKLKALKLLPKVISIESKRSAEQSVTTIKNLLNLLR
jgi:flavin-dependent dehydrogenase